MTFADPVYASSGSDVWACVWIEDADKEHVGPLGDKAAALALWREKEKSGVVSWIRRVG